VRGDVDDAASLRAAMRGAGGVFCNTDFWTSLSPRQEYAQGVRALEAARAEGVTLFVWSSLDGAALATSGEVPVPHYDGKAAVEAHIALERSEAFMRRDAEPWYARHVATLVTAPYYENFAQFFRPERGPLPDGREGLTFALASGAAPHLMVALADIGAFARLMLADPATWGGRTLRILGDALTGPEIAATYERVTGTPAAWRDVPLDAVASGSPVGHDLAHMHRFFQAGGVVRDLAGLRRLRPGLLSFAAWLRQTGGEAATHPTPRRGRRHRPRHRGPKRARPLPLAPPA
jgi:uncharacterized protein YbjT (DUF2867 family)